ncbi:Translation protein, beta-barrel domain [Pseudocohnilembus persalinus]|uniref:Translation protein, beta-barrel domain n=1 Tax=Pseudocohnilembus persalinus TaxID=266149 RepID=A0A0V0QCI4_PSEPJ|nr:Translation protein, beta-barrel domain [Pseudocohnilembus persalinus]|eukprot:KRW99958.1 Translation protein, beta-barrel domain [Pseudocohnilembus persalinus]
MQKLIINNLYKTLNTKPKLLAVYSSIDLKSFNQKPKYNISIKEKIRQERLERLQREKEILPTNTSDDINLIRNIGIIAHIDAGKTTTTERMLYYAGVLQAPGEVHDGNTVMDFMDQERERGITIRSAAISFKWKNHQFNVLDTPGHIDFTGEVERSLRILDGAVAIFDSVSGVQTQSEMVWYQSNKFNIPRIAFFNKMDRNGANLENTLQSIKSKLNIQPLVLQMPLGEGEDFKGIIDVLNLLEIQYVGQSGDEVTINPLTPDSKYYQKAIAYREELLDVISLYNDELADKILEGEEISTEIIEKEIQKLMQQHSQEYCPVFVGSSLKNKGIQLLMDGIIKYLPPPSDEAMIRSIKNKYLIRKQKQTEKLTALVYKIINDPVKGALTFVRVYSGVLSSKSMIKNITRGINEKCMHLFRVRANDYIDIKEIGSGDIAAIQGMKYTQAGDTLLLDNDLEDFVLEEMQMPQPVFMAALEYQSLKDKTNLENALATIVREDNSFQFKEDGETGQLIISGLGELHLEIVRDRLEREFKINTNLGKMRVSYREGIQDSFELTYTFEKMMSGKPLYIELQMSIEPIDESEIISEIEEEEEDIEDQDEQVKKVKKQKKQMLNQVVIDFEREPEFDIYYREFKKRSLVAEREKKIESTLENIEEIQSNSQLSNLRFIKNPVKPVEVDKLVDDYGEETLYDISGIQFEKLLALEKTIYNGFSKGHLMSYPLQGVRVRILGGKYSNRRTNTIAMEQAGNEMMVEMIENASPILLEPIMNVEISSPEENQKEIMNDVMKQRRGKVIDIQEENSKFGQQVSNRFLIKAEIPLLETVGYSSYLRSISKGEAAFLMQFKKFDYVGGQKQKQMLEDKFF